MVLIVFYCFCRVPKYLATGSWVPVWRYHSKRNLWLWIIQTVCLDCHKQCIPKMADNSDTIIDFSRYPHVIRAVCQSRKHACNLQSASKATYFYIIFLPPLASLIGPDQSKKSPPVMQSPWILLRLYTGAKVGSIGTRVAACSGTAHWFGIDASGLSEGCCPSHPGLYQRMSATPQ